MNSYLKKYVEAEYPLQEFISSIDLALSKMRHRELQHDYTSKHTAPQLPLELMHSEFTTNNAGNYRALNLDANTKNYYASKVESSYKTTKDEIVRLTAIFKDAFETNSTNNNHTQRASTNYMSNSNIVIDSIVVRAKGTSHVGLLRNRVHINASIGAVKRARLCRICYGVMHDAHNCSERDRVRRSIGGASSSDATFHQEQATEVHNATRLDNMIDATQNSINTSNFMY
ncbi:hypothetical protein PanWU01x14_336780 [Parasponia andersonii]|uniref:Uncharacterized protein n=1 Tax=Parasponia andersonii TaxID=3476 RepID=A0A2P5AFR3_PARAD|nr:hypothetical protein PanWU01x14_336780 [Parasponia andersonii]